MFRLFGTCFAQTKQQTTFKLGMVTCNAFCYALHLLYWLLLTGMARTCGLHHNKSKLRKKRLEKCCNEGEAEYQLQSLQLRNEGGAENLQSLQLHNEGGAENQLHSLQLQASVPGTWSCQTPVLYCRISQQSSASTAPLRITHCLRI